MANSIKQNVKKARKCENLNDPIDAYIIDYVAMFFSSIFIKLHIIPNVITVLSGIVGVTGGILLIFDSLLLNVIGVLLIILSAVFDACDGQVARLTKRYSNLGRTLDGLFDLFVYLSIYIALCIRLFPANIPFTDIQWGWRIIPLAFIAFYFHGAQARTADYFKNLHMYMIKNNNELSRSSNIKKEIAECKSFFERLRLKGYLLYTKAQESDCPKNQKLLDKTEQNGGVSEQLSEAYGQKSRKYVKFTNFLTFNLRTIILFILLFLPYHLECFFFPLLIVVFEVIRVLIILKFEKLAKSLLNREELFVNTERNDK